jgi:exopolysaccharide production protein ExoZ
MLEFVFGMGLALWLKNLRTSKIYTWLAVAGIVALFALPAADFDRSLRYGLIASEVVGASVLAIWPPIKLLKLIGDASYSIYISHFFVLSAFVQFWKYALGRPGSWASLTYFFFAGATLSALAGILCWTVVEKPITSWCKDTRRALRNRTVRPDGMRVDPNFSTTEVLVEKAAKID